MKNQKGFTLVEIIVTVVILAVLMAVAVPVSLSYLDDVQEKKILNEAQAVYNVAKVGSRSNRLSLAGQYVSTSGTYYEIDSDILASYVSKAKGTGVIKNLEFVDDDIVFFRYKYNETTYVRYSKETGIFEIETNPDFETIAEIIMTSKEPLTLINNYFKNRAPAGNNIATIDSEAPSKEQSSEFNGIGKDIYNWLNQRGINSDYFSWKAIFEKVETESNQCEHGKSNIYAIYICEKKIDSTMIGQEINVNVYKFYSDGCKYDLDKSFDTTLKATIVNKFYKGFNYPVLNINGVV